MCDHQYLIGYSATPSQSFMVGPKRTQEIDPFETFYTKSDLAVGYRRCLWEKETKWEGGFVVGGYRTAVKGGIENRDSHLELFGLEGGVYQNIYRYAFASLALGGGYAKTHLNFGDGKIPPAGSSLNARGTLSLGAQYCFTGWLCPNLFLAGSYERSLNVDPNYMATSLSVGFSVTGSVDSFMSLFKTKQETDTTPPPGFKETPPTDVVASRPVALPEDIKKQLEDLAEDLKKNPNKVVFLIVSSALYPSAADNRLDAYRILLSSETYLFQNLKVNPSQVKTDRQPIQTLSPLGDTSATGRSVAGKDESPEMLGGRSLKIVEEKK